MSIDLKQRNLDAEILPVVAEAPTAQNAETCVPHYAPRLRPLPVRQAPAAESQVSTVPTLTDFPLTAKYDPRWIAENALGENAL